ncbi:MAG TPA: hypothetical protein VF131_03555 [Blastocatellia bacterium]|nr:hypothetical protein [Blastocatellia bacterium]
MNPTDKDEILIRRYLLGEVTDQEREQVERQLMTDKQYLDHILSREEALIDEYVRGELGRDERGPFETYFLSAPERRDRLEFAESLNRYIAESRTLKSADVAATDGEAAVSRDAIFRLGQLPTRPAIALLAVATLILIVGAIILLIENARLREQILERQANLSQAEEGLRQQLDEQRERNKELARQLEQSQEEMSRIEQELAGLNQEKSRHREIPASITASLIIAPGSVRDKGQINRVDLTTDIRQLRLELKLQGENYQSYRVEVRTVEGKSIWKEVNLRARQQAGEKSVVTTLPARHLPEGDYLVTLSASAAGRGYEKVATYYFTILRD